MDRLMLVSECLSILIYPFHWVSTYAPILPYSQLEFIESPVTYLMGLCYDDKIPDQIFQVKSKKFINIFSQICVFLILILDNWNIPKIFHNFLDKNK